MPRSKPVALWAVPRSVSTALERVFVERGDFLPYYEELHERRLRPNPGEGFVPSVGRE